MSIETEEQSKFMKLFTMFQIKLSPRMYVVFLAVGLALSFGVMGVLIYLTILHNSTLSLCSVPYFTSIFTTSIVVVYLWVTLVDESRVCRKFVPDPEEGDVSLYKVVPTEDSIKSETTVTENPPSYTETVTPPPSYNSLPTPEGQTQPLENPPAYAESARQVEKQNQVHHV